MNRTFSIPWLPRRGLVGRTRQIVSVLTRHGWGWIISQMEANSAARRAVPGTESETNQHKQAEHLRKALNELGATFIKLGQALSTRPDLLPPEYIAELGKLQDEVPPLPFEKMEQVLIQELGKPAAEIFDQFDPTPLASASIGQVYAGQLKNGQKAVIKIRRPGVAKLIDQDLEILTTMAEWITAHSNLGQLYDLPAFVSEFSFRLRNELDYVREGQNADIFRKNFADDKSVYIPYVHWNLTTHQVITMERVYGIKINDVAAMKQASINMRLVAENAGRFTLRQLFEFGFFHADPHPGNFFVQPDGSLAVLDFGMVGRLTPSMKNSLLVMVMAMATRDAETLVDELMDAGMTRKPVRQRALAMDLEHIFESYAGGSAQFLSATQVLNEILTIAYRHGLQMPGELAMLGRLSAINEGISMTLYPEFRMLDFAAPYVLRSWQEQRSPQKLIPRLGKTAIDGLELSLNLPRQTSRLLKQMERGQLEFNINYDGLRDIVAQMQKMANRMSLSIIIGATIVALGMVVQVYIPPEWAGIGRMIFGGAFVFSVAFGIYIMWSIWKSGRT
jgi:ubiquinone biosynthesis protein